MFRSLVIAILLTPACSRAGVFVAFPHENARLPAIGCVYCIGAAEPTGSCVRVNGETVATSRTGGFLTMVRVAPGTNRIVVTAGGATCVRTFAVAGSAAAAPSLAGKGRPAPVAAGASVPPAGGAATTHDPYRDLGIPANAPVRSCAHRRPADVTVMIDPGHGGDDGGAVSPHGWREKDANLLLARAIRDALAAAGFRVMMTRDDDTYPPLYNRPRAVWQLGGDLFISVHHNATPADRDPRRARHTTTYASNAAGLALARAVQRHIGREMAPVRDQGAQLKSLAVCRNPVVPSCLLEVDFINLPEGEEESWDPARRRRIARAVTLGVLDYLQER